jgi:retinol dehydrogenase-14
MAEDARPARRHRQVEGVTGRYFVDHKPNVSNKVSYDTAAAARLWKASADLVGFTTVGRT